MKKRVDISFKMNYIINIRNEKEPISWLQNLKKTNSSGTVCI